MKLHTMSLADLKKLEAQIEAAKGAAHARARNEVKSQIIAIAAAAGFKLSDLFGPKRMVAPKYRDKKTGVLWSGRGRIPRDFDKARSEHIGA